MKVRKWKVTFDLYLAEGAGHPRKWVPEAVWQGMEPEHGEDCEGWVFEDLGVMEHEDI